MNSVENGRLSAAEAQEVNARLEKAAPQEIIAWAAHAFGDKLVMTSSFGADSMCTIHLATQVMPNIKIVFVNTGYLFPETLAFMQEMRERFHLNVLEFHTRNDPVVWLTVNGEPDPRVRKNVAACCAANKDPVIDRAMADLAPAAYLRGIRATQTRQRAEMKPLEWMNRFSAWAVSPVLRWSTRQIFDYMQQHNLPHHPLWELGYSSIGCNPETCTRPVTLGEDERSGRWAGTDKKECGINLDLGRDI